MDKHDEFQVGVITQPHGLKGEVKVFPTTDDAARFLDLDEVILDNGKERLVLKIEGVKFFKKFAILKFQGYDSIEAIEKYKRASLLVTREQAVPLEEGEYFVADMLGMQVVTEEGELLGVLKEVLTTGANDVYVVAREGQKDALLPAIRECVRDIDMERRVITVHIMGGLL